MRETRLSGLMRGGSWPTHLGQLLPTLPAPGKSPGLGHRKQARHRSLLRLRVASLTSAGSGLSASLVDND